MLDYSRTQDESGVLRKANGVSQERNSRLQASLCLKLAGARQGGYEKVQLSGQIKTHTCKPGGQLLIVS